MPEQDGTGLGLEGADPGQLAHREVARLPLQPEGQPALGGVGKPDVATVNGAFLGDAGRAPLVLAAEDELRTQFQIPQKCGGQGVSAQ